MANNKSKQQNNNNNKQQLQKVEEFQVAIVLPQHLWTQVHSLKTQPDKRMVYIKLLQVGLPQPDMDQIATKVTSLASRFPAFTLSFDTLSVEPSSSGDTTSVQIRLLPSPEHAEIVCRMNKELESILGINPSARAFAPFLQLGSVPKTQSAAAIARMQKDFKPINASIHTLYFLARDGKDFVIRKSFALPAQPSSTSSSSPPSASSIPVATNNNNNNKSPVKGKTNVPIKGAEKDVKVVKEVKVEEDKAVETGPCFRFSGDAWAASDESVKVSAHQLKIATFNVLFDFHDADKIHTHLRTPATFAILRDLHADVIGLEEVTQGFLEKLLSEEWVRTNYYVSTLESGYYGQMILSRFPFRSCSVNLGKPVPKKIQHTVKKAVVAEFALNGRIAHVAVVHLTSDKSENAVEKRKLQIDQVNSWMASRGTDNFIVGDFNFGDDGQNVLPSEYDDVWCVLHPNDAGFTYDTDNNTMAQITTNRFHNTRFDRILSAAPRWTPTSMSLFAHQPIGVVEGKNLFASDHYGVVANFEVAARVRVPNFELSQESLADPLAAYLGAQGMLPDVQYADSRKRVLRFLEEVMEDVFGTAEWRMELIGSSRLGVDVGGSDLDMVVIGTMPRHQFFEYSVKVLSAQASVADLRAVVDTVVPVVKLTIGGIHIDIQYCCMPYAEIPKRCADINTLTLLKLDKPSLVAINGVIDAELIVSAVPDMSTFRLLLFFVKLWAKRRNIYSTSIGYPGGYPLAILAAHLYNACPSLTPSQLVVQFFKFYAEWNTQTTGISLPGVALPTLDPKKNAIPIFTPSKPVKPAIRNATQSTRIVVEQEFSRAGGIVRTGDAGATLWNQLLAENDAVTKLGTYLVLVVSTNAEQDFLQWAGFIESRLVDVILQLERILRTKEPARSVRPLDRKYLSAQSPTQRAQFLIGVDVAPERCQEFAQLFATQLDFSAFTRGAADGMSISVDVTSDAAHIFAEHAQASKAIGQRKAREEVKLAPFHSVRAEGVFAEKEEEEEAEDDSSSIITAIDEEVEVGENHYAQASKMRSEQAKKNVEMSSKKLRMRTSVEVFNRIMWDSSLPKSDFIIGYDDRFIGIMEVPFEEFDLESIPLHRIRIFKRKGVVVWSRNDRVDSVFKY